MPGRWQGASGPAHESPHQFSPGKWPSFRTRFVDFDLDGLEDLFISNGHAIRFSTGKAGRFQKPVLMQGFEESTAGGDEREPAEPVIVDPLADEGRR